MSRLAWYAVVIGGSLLLLCACAKQGHPAVAPTDSPLTAGTAVPTRPTSLIPAYESLPSPTPSIELADQPLTDTLTVSERVPPAADLAIQVPGPVQVVPGETAVYTLTIRNDGPAPATDIVLTDVLPEGVMPVWTQPAQPVCRRQGRNISCAMGDLREGDATSVTLDLSVGGTETLITDTQLAGVTLDLSAPACAIDQDSTQPHVTCRLNNLQPGADAHIRVGVGVDARITGSLVHAATVSANETDKNRSNNHATFIMTVGAGGPGPPAPGMPRPGLDGTGQAQVGEVEGPVTVTAIPTTDLVVQADGPSSVIAGQPFTYTFTVTNQGELDATGVSFEDVVPSDMNLIAYAPGLPLCEQQDDALTCYLRDLDSSETITFTLVITGHGGQPMKMGLDPLMPGWPFCFVVKERTWQHIVHCELGVLKRSQEARVQLVLMAIGVLERMTSNTASVTANETELNPLDNTNTMTMTVQVRADLSVWSAISGPALAGKTLSYTLTVANSGPSDADDVVLVDRLPALPTSASAAQVVGGPGPVGTSLVSAVPSQGDNCRVERDDTSADAVICNLGRLSSGETASVTIVVAVDKSLTPALAEALIHSARVMAKPADPNPGNNELTESIPVNAGGED